MSSTEFDVKLSSLPELENPILICGLPGSGFVGKLSIDYLIEKLRGTKFADIFSSSFPAQVTIQADGTIELSKCSLFFCKNNPNDLVFLTSDAQPVSPQAE